MSEKTILNEDLKKVILERVMDNYNVPNTTTVDTLKDIFPIIPEIIYKSIKRSVRTVVGHKTPLVEIEDEQFNQVFDELGVTIQYSFK